VPTNKRTLFIQLASFNWISNVRFYTNSSLISQAVQERLRSFRRWAEEALRREFEPDPTARKAYAEVIRDAFARLK